MYTDEMREATKKAYTEKQRTKVYKTPREALNGVCSMGRHATDREVVQWLADLQARSNRELNADDSYTLASARTVIKRLTRELQQRDRFLDQRIDIPMRKIWRSLQGSFLEEDLREQRDELMTIKLENKRIQEHLKKGTVMAHYKSTCPLPSPHERELLTILIEECAEVQKRATKILRFGIIDCQPGQSLRNSQRLGLEIGDVLEMIDQLTAAGVVSTEWITRGKESKRKQLLKFMQTRVEFDPDSGVPMLPIPEFCTLYKCVTTSERANYEGGKYNCIGDETRRLMQDENGFWVCPTCHNSYGSKD